MRAAEANRTWPAAGIRRVEIRGGRLAVRVRPGDRLTWDGPPSVEAEQEGSSLVLRTPHHRRWGGWIGPEDTLVLTLPPTVTSLSVRSTGDMDIRDLDLEADLHLRAGDLRASGCRGRWRIRSGAGDVTLVDQQGDLDVQTGAGKVTVRGGHLRRARIRTGAGDVQFATWVDVEAEVTTGAGSVDLRPRHPGGARIQARSGFGSVVLDLSGVRGGRMELQTGAGHIHLPGGIHVGRRGGLGQRVVDVLGPGEGVIEITTGAGSVRVVGYGTQPWGAHRAAYGAVAGAGDGRGARAGSDSGGSTGAGTEAGAGLGPGASPAAAQEISRGHWVAESPGAVYGASGGAAQAPPQAAPQAGVSGPYRDARQVLEALARGELTVEEADRWLRALETAAPPPLPKVEGETEPDPGKDAPPGR
ncbi:Protein of unknown function DUF2089 [Thermaerobacter marianensis DSM 12885]|uniref:DUF4097 domain-containing protein n=1 Tax=Thermaerobacter marianensis (strain ATCC 700841 / DSM 12885 / JCM 10246 / 7p75a) TaxID=644966 RepID=E6SMR7_THEM7|nr:DUF4097 family beta strand repeat-containing protein [Thermaerobacter marianensis]ADU51559.1 Protein of unknown function DUF2089 [Thermaerobacter marianensis DSM 12885]